MGRLEIQEVIHEELLAKIQVFLVATELQSIDENFEGTKMLKALRAVVELHKPEWVLLKIVLQGTKPDPVAICSHCSDEQWRKSYPCPTIEAIEKELG